MERKLMALFQWQTCSTTKGPNRLHGLTLMRNKGLWLRHSKTSTGMNKFMIRMERSAILGSSSTMDLLLKIMMVTKFLSKSTIQSLMKRKTWRRKWSTTIQTSRSLESPTISMRVLCMSSCLGWGLWNMTKTLLCWLITRQGLPVRLQWMTQTLKTE